MLEGIGGAWPARGCLPSVGRAQPGRRAGEDPGGWQVTPAVSS